MRVLVADDDRLTALRIGRTLERWNLDVVVANDGRQAWEAVQRDAGISLVILDWMMPGLDGSELCRRIRRDASRAHLYVILLTARDGQSDRVAGLDAGADDYLAKNSDPEEFRARVQVGMRVVALQERLASRVTELEQALAHVEQLHGLLPICSYCKKVRSDGDYWEQVESYVSQHSEIRFSHGICPSCLERAMSELDGN
jgi:DNA-binding response OmpR family regulator